MAFEITTLRMPRKIGKCGACKATVARDYSDFVERTKGAGMFARKVKVYGRRVDGIFIEAAYDARCPSCNAKAWHGQMVQGVTSQHACDARCTEAKGFRCECSCGGKNHGAGLLVCEGA